MLRDLIRFAGLEVIMNIYHMTSLLSYDHTCNNTLAHMRNIIDNVRVNKEFSA